MVHSIPELTADEQAILTGYLSRADKNGDGMLTFAEFKAAVASGQGPSSSSLQPPQPQASQPGVDSAEVLQLLHDYLTENESVLREYFSQADKDRNGEDAV